MQKICIVVHSATTRGVYSASCLQWSICTSSPHPHPVVLQQWKFTLTGAENSPNEKLKQGLSQDSPLIVLIMRSEFSVSSDWIVKRCATATARSILADADMDLATRQQLALFKQWISIRENRSRQFSWVIRAISVTIDVFHYYI